MVDEIQAFIAAVKDEDAVLDRLLATVLFTDIVGSTERARELGDRAWGELLEAHHARVRAQLARFRSREIDTTGDGFLATFDGPARGVRCAQAIARSKVPMSPPTVVSDAIVRAVEAKRPRTRYVAGKFARPLMFVRKYLGDRLYDRVIMSQVG